ncbi:MAG: hypothetical protein QNL61_01185 [Crocinitomicaceae bacterium]|jgi:hypothetical protein
MDTLDNIHSENEPRPKFLTVLCILTFIATGMSLLTGIYNLLITGRQSKDAMLGAKVEMTQSINEMKDLGMTGFVELLEKIQRMSVEINDNFYFAGLFGLLLTIIGLYSAIRMWKGSKLGFHIYIIYNLLAIGGLYLYVSPANVPSVFVIFNVVLSVAFIFMYSRNLKWMR